jgi:hypothetical protein
MNEVHDFLMPLLYASVAFTTLFLAFDAILGLLVWFVRLLAGE